MGQNVLVRRIPEQYFFGYEYRTHGDFSLPVSDVEKNSGRHGLLRGNEKAPGEGVQKKD